MKVLVYDVAAESSGALTILQMIYNRALSEYKETDWVFVVSVANIKPADNVRVLRRPSVKKSWLHRIWFDVVSSQKMLKEENPDYVLNLQNVAVRCRCPQIMYVQHSMPFTTRKVSLVDFKLWLYKYAIGALIKRSCKRADQIIVQTDWMKTAIAEQCGVPTDRITVRHPVVEIGTDQRFVSSGQPKTFFYPASAFRYKRHDVIVEASALLQQRGFAHKIIFTLRGDEDKHLLQLKNRADEQKLPISWVGAMTKAEVFETYAHSTLVFPSEVETFGLPLAEARQMGCPILAARTPFALEICENYAKAAFFEAGDCQRLAELMMTY